MTKARFDGVTESSMPCALLDLTFLARRLFPGKSGNMLLIANRRSREDRCITWDVMLGNSKLQLPNSKQITNSKSQIKNGDSSFEHFGFCILDIVWNLVFGYWDFRCIAFRAMHRDAANRTSEKNF